MKLGENTAVRRFVRFSTRVNGRLRAWHKIGVLVDYTGRRRGAGQGYRHAHRCQQAGLRIQGNKVPADLLAKEREIYTAQAAESGKPPTSSRRWWKAGHQVPTPR